MEEKRMKKTILAATVMILAALNLHRASAGNIESMKAQAGRDVQETLGAAGESRTDAAVRAMANPKAAAFGRVANLVKRLHLPQGPTAGVPAPQDAARSRPAALKPRQSALLKFKSSFQGLVSRIGDWEDRHPTLVLLGPAAVGAAIGTAFAPGPGTLVGAVLGGSIGFLVQAFSVTR